MSFPEMRSFGETVVETPSRDATEQRARTARMVEAERTGASMTLAFGADPTARWIFPDPHQYLTFFPALVRALGGSAFENGSAHVLEDFRGAALWLPPGVEPDEASLFEVIEQAVTEDLRDDVLGVFEQMGTYHPKEPHWYLPLIGVEPAHQRNGYGSVLLRYGLATCDRQERLAYLESSNPRNIPLYERHGFEVIGEIRVGSSPPVTPMLRRPSC